jgi:hypothetical protein
LGLRRSGRGVEDGEQVGGGVRALAGKPASVFAAEGDTGAGGFVNQKEQAAAGGDQDLRVVAAIGEQFVAFVERGFEVGGVLDGAAKDRRAEGVKGAGGGVDDDEAVVGEGGGNEAGKGRGEGRAGGVAGGEQVEFGCAADEFRGTFEKRDDAGAEVERADGLSTPASKLAGDPGLRGGGLLGMEAQGVRRVTRGEDDVVGFGEVVVLGGEPEDGDGVGRLSAPDDGGGLQECEEGSAEEGDLLTADDGSGALAEALDVGEGLCAEGRGVSVPESVLFEELVGDGGAVGGILSGGGIGPGLRPGSGDEEGG